jgi:hypothetical protein
MRIHVSRLACASRPVPLGAPHFHTPNSSLRLSEERNLEAIAKLNLVYRCGVDSAGRAVIVMVVGHLPTFEISLDDVVLYLYRVIEDIVETDYSVVLVNGPISSKNTPSFAHIARAIRVLPRMYDWTVLLMLGCRLPSTAVRFHSCHVPATNLLCARFPLLCTALLQVSQELQAPVRLACEHVDEICAAVLAVYHKQEVLEEGHRSGRRATAVHVFRRRHAAASSSRFQMGHGDECGPVIGRWCRRLWLEYGVVSVCVSVCLCVCVSVFVPLLSVVCC